MKDENSPENFGGETTSKNSRIVAMSHFDFFSVDPTTSGNQSSRAFEKTGSPGKKWKSRNVAFPLFDCSIFRSPDDQWRPVQLASHKSWFEGRKKTPWRIHFSVIIMRYPTASGDQASLGSIKAGTPRFIFFLDLFLLTGQEKKDPTTSGDQSSLGAWLCWFERPP